MTNAKTHLPMAVKRILAVLLAVILLLSIAGGLKVEAASSGFHVSGTTILDANNNAFVMRGVNVAHAWYSSYTETSLKAISDLGANTVRVVISDGAQYSKTSYSELQNIINMCKQYQLVCILEVHDATGSDSVSDLNAAANYWVEMKGALSGQEAYVILNIANEWYGSTDGSTWASAYQSAIKTIRNAGISNMIMVDSAGWGQAPDSIRYYGKSVFNADSHANTVFSIHMYEYAGGDASTVKSNIDNALGIGVPVVIGEFGHWHSNGDVDEYTIMSYCQQKGVGYLGWSWKGNGGGVEYLDLSNNWDGSSLTDWGNTLFYDSYGIKNTSSKCSVFTGSSSSGGSSSGSSSSGSSSSSSSEYASLFYGSASASNWGQAVSVYTTRAGGSFDASNITSGGCFYVEYKGSQDQVELVLQSWSGGSDWGKVSISESGTANGNYYAKFSYDNCVSTFGSSNFSSQLDAVHVSAKSSNLEVISVCYIYGSGSSSSSGNSSNNNSSNNNSSNNNSSNNNSSSSSSGYASVFWGSASASNWGQAVSVYTTRAGGDFDASNITSGGCFYVEYKGTQDQVELILQSWSGGSDWGKVSISESGTANGNYYAKFSYNNCVSTFGSSNFSSQLDAIHIGAQSSNIEVVSVCYIY